MKTRSAIILLSIQIGLAAFVFYQSSTEFHIKPGKSTMIWYLEKDTSKVEIGKVATIINRSEDSILVITRVELASSDKIWIDTTVNKSGSLDPIYHSSYNQSRDIRIVYGDSINIYYKDNLTENTGKSMVYFPENYYDSNLLPVLVRFLPYEPDYVTTFNIHDFNPSKGAKIKKVDVGVLSKDKIQTHSGTKDTWKVSVTIDDDPQSRIIFYIDCNDQTLWKQEMDTPNGKMFMEDIKSDH